MEVTFSQPNQPALDTIVADLQAKPLMIVGGREAGKSLIAKHILDQARSYNPNLDARAFDNSLSWYHSSPLMYRQLVDRRMMLNMTKAYTDTIYEIGELDKDQRREFISTIIKNEYEARYMKVMADPNNLSKMHWSLNVIEECQSLLDKYKTLGSPIHDWISVGRNFRMTAMFCTQRLAEVDTAVVERCSILAGYCEGDNNRQKIRRAASKEFYDIVINIPFKSYYFAYYNGDIYKNIRISPIPYPAPNDYPVSLSDVPENPWRRKMML